MKEVAIQFILTCNYIKYKNNKIHLKNYVRFLNERYVLLSEQIFFQEKEIN